ncbi:MAG: hypothetical protein JF563_05245, partial [Acidobacteriales bacterium]|nr:hypothetical protein [Terriglobales bacterium]
MRKFIAGLLAATATVSATVAAAAPVASKPYLNPSLPAETRAADLVHRMTLE